MSSTSIRSFPLSSWIIDIFSIFLLSHITWNKYTEGKSLCHPLYIRLNLLGFESSESDYQSQRRTLAAIPNAHVYWYGKTQSRPGRKLGHVTVLLTATTPQERRSQAEAIVQDVESIWYGSSLS